VRTERQTDIESERGRHICTDRETDRSIDKHLDNQAVNQIVY